MQNRFQITSDDERVDVRMTIHTERSWRMVLLGMILAVLIMLICAFFFDPNTKTLYILFVLLGIVLIWPVRYFLWNTYGKESLTITKGALSYQYDYGWFKTRRRTLPFDRLSLGHQIIQKGESNLEYKGQLMLFDYDKEGDRWYEFYRTSVLLTEIQMKRIDIEIIRLFEKDFLKYGGFQGFSLN